MIDWQAVRIENINFSATGVNEIYENLRILYTTPEGAVPFNRKFGINTSFLDEPDPIAQGRMIVEYTQKTRQFEPRATVKEVYFDVDTQNGKMVPRVVIEFAEQSA